MDTTLLVPEPEYWMVVMVEEAIPTVGLEDITSGWIAKLADETAVFVSRSYGVIPVVGDMARIVVGADPLIPMEFSLDGRVLWEMSEESYRDFMKAREERIRSLVFSKVLGVGTTPAPIPEIPDTARDEVQQRAAARLAEWGKSGRDAYRIRVAALPTMLRERMKAFEQQKGDSWAMSIGQVELFVCEEAHRIAMHPLDEIEEWEQDEAAGTADQEHYAKKFAMPIEKHNEVTWHISRVLALVLHKCPEKVIRIHSALCSVLGCRECGCWSTTEGAALARVEERGGVNAYRVSFTHVVAAKNEEEAVAFYSALDEPKSPQFEGAQLLDPDKESVQADIGYGALPHSLGEVIAFCLRTGIEPPFVLLSTS